MTCTCTSPKRRAKATWVRRRQVLRREEQDLVAQEGLVELAKDAGVHVGGKLDAGDLGAELRRQRSDTHCPRSSGRQGLLRVLMDSRKTTKSVCSAAVSFRAGRAAEPFSE